MYELICQGQLHFSNIFASWLNIRSQFKHMINDEGHFAQSYITVNNLIMTWKMILNLKWSLKVRVIIVFLNYLY